MSRVAIRDLYMDIADNCCDYADEEFDILTDTEIVPRKLVEKIIEYCKSDEDATIKAEAARAEACLIRYYAECLLKQFEEDE